MSARNWDILLIGGASGVGKTSLSYPLARHFGVAITEIDDVHQAVLAMTTPAQYPALHFWREHPEAQELPPHEILTHALAVPYDLEPALEAVIANHLACGPPLIIEGDFIHPSFAARTRFGDQDSNGRVRALFLIETDIAQIEANYAAREGGALQAKRAQVSALHSEWLKSECQQHSVPALEARPWATLEERARAVIC